jgi:hypothetical protein
MDLHRLYREAELYLRSDLPGHAAQAQCPGLALTASHVRSCPKSVIGLVLVIKQCSQPQKRMEKCAYR